MGFVQINFHEEFNVYPRICGKKPCEFDTGTNIKMNRNITIAQKLKPQKVFFKDKYFNMDSI